MGADQRQTTQATSSAANALTSELPRYRHAFGLGQRECGTDVPMLPKLRVLNTLRDVHPHVARGTGHTSRVDALTGWASRVILALWTTCYHDVNGDAAKSEAM